MAAITSTVNLEKNACFHLLSNNSKTQSPLHVFYTAVGYVQMCTLNSLHWLTSVCEMCGLRVSV